MNRGGDPGGGCGYGGNKLWSAGGGGGFSALYLHTARGKVTLLIASGGGGGGSRNGVPGEVLRAHLAADVNVNVQCIKFL